MLQGRDAQVDTVIWGKDWDLSNKFWTRGTAWLDTSMFKHAAGKPTSDIIHLPPVCNQTSLARRPS